MSTRIHVELYIKIWFFFSNRIAGNGQNNGLIITQTYATSTMFEHIYYAMLTNAAIPLNIQTSQVTTDECNIIEIITSPPRAVPLHVLVVPLTWRISRVYLVCIHIMYIGSCRFGMVVWNSSTLNNTILYK